jgi:signal peptidase I
VAEVLRRWDIDLVLTDCGPEQIPAGHLFVLGDNRDNSRDSRFWGYVPVGDVLGIAKVVYFSWDARESRVRWERVGQSLH